MTKSDIIEIAVRILGLVLIGVAIANIWHIVFYLNQGPPPLRDADGRLSYFISIEGISPKFHPHLPAVASHVLICAIFGLLFACFAPWITRVVFRVQPNQRLQLTGDARE